MHISSTSAVVPGPVRLLLAIVALLCLNGVSQAPRASYAEATFPAHVDGAEALPSPAEGLAAGVPDRVERGEDTAAAAYTPAPAPSAPALLNASPQTAAGVVHPGTTVRRDLCLTVSAGPGAAYECGDLRLVHALPTTRTLNAARTPVLLYNSQHAQPRPVVPFNLQMTAGSAPTSVTAILHVGPIGGPQVERARQTWTGAWQEGGLWRFAVSYDAGPDDSDVYAYTLQVLGTFGGVQSQMNLYTGELAVVNRSGGPAGSSLGGGWAMAGVEQRIWLRDGARALVIGGDGSTRVYRWVATNTAVSENVDRPDTLRSVYIDAQLHSYRRLPNGSIVWYNPQGRHYKTVTRLGHTTWFSYDSGGRLHQIILPMPATSSSSAAYVFGYEANGGGLAWICAIVSGTSCRNTIALHGHNDHRITGFTDPDQRTTGFGYGDAANPRRVTTRTDKRLTTVSYGYDAAGKLSSVTVPLDNEPAIVSHFQAAEGKGLTSAVRVDQAFTLLDGPRNDVNDHTRLWLTRWGAPERIRNALEQETVLTRGDSRFPALVTQSLAPNGLVSRAWYNARGLMDSTRVVNPLGDGRHAVTRYQWDARWNAPTRVSTLEVTGAVAREIVGSSLTEYDPATGNPRWQQQGGDAARRVNYSYYPAGHPLYGMVSRVRTPVDVANGTPGDSVAYDAFGNLQSEISTTGIRTDYVNDWLGRPWVTVSPVDPANGLFRRDSVVYDAMDRVEWSISTGPALTNPGASWATGVPSTTPEERLFVHNTYDQGGNVLAVRRWSVPDTARVGTMITRFEYDRAGRKRAEIAADGARDSTYYDPAGNVETAVTRRGYRITMTYDALNRLRTRSVPGTITAPRFASSIGHGGVFNFPTRGTDASGNATVAGSSASVTLSGETQRFEYDIAGNLVYAANRDAIVRRRYNHNGTLAGDTLIIATYATRDTTQHVYGLRYQYDVMGRRTDLHHPAVLAPEGGWTVHNEYDPVTGALVAVSDPIGTHQFHFNTAGQLAGETFANGAAETYTHDAEGRLHTRTLTIPSMGVLDADTMTYDMRGKLRVVRQRIGSVQNFYSGLGSLAWSRSTPDNYNYTEQGYIQDALGNTAIAQKFDFQNRDHPKVELTRQTYDTLGTGRLLRVRGYPGWGSDPTSGGNMEYDVGGNNTFASDSRVYDAIANSRRVEAKASYYDAADRLRIVDMQACAWTDIQKAQGMKGTGDGANLTCTHLRAGDRSAFEEYRYDALGRRVLVRTLEGCLDSCIETVTRTVWDGDRLLWEIRAPGAHRERDVVPEGQLPPYNITTGRVAYTFGAALDHPLAVHRFDYRDSIFQRYDTVPVPLINQPLTIYPHTNWRGDYQIGTYITGETSRCAWVLTQQEDEDKYEPIEEPGWDGPPPANGGGQGHRHCLAPVPWPGKYIWLDHSVRAAPPGNPDLWVGSLVKNKRDLTGNLYMRNRYYDARAGRFSQEDPIGLAGGLNAYGFAAGDPVSYSDPYGLCPCVLAIPLAIGALSTLETVAVLGVTGVLVAAHIHSGPRAIAAARSIAGSATSTQSDRRDPRPVYHRKVSAVETAQVLQSGEVWGRPPRNFIQSDIPKVQAFNGPLPPGQSGYEFVTDVEPDKGTPPWLASWSGDRWGVTTEDGFAKINVAVTKVQP